MEYSLLQQVAYELSEVISGARVERVYQGAGSALYIVLRKNRKDHVLLLSPDPALPRLHLVTTKPAAAKAAAGFVQYLRKHVTGSTIAGVALVNQDRVFEVIFRAQDMTMRLIFELFGPAAHLLLTDETFTIRSIYRPRPLTGNEKRVLLPGMVYSPPTRPEKTKDGHQPRSLSTGRSSQKQKSALSANREAERHYARLLDQKRRTDIRAQLTSVIKKALVKAERRIAALDRDRATAEKASSYRQSGELILANLKSIQQGMGSIELTGYDGQAVTIVLNPRNAPTVNAEKYFKKYKKAKAGIEIIMRRLGDSRDEAALLRGMRSSLEAGEETVSLEAIRDQLTAKGYIKKSERARAKGTSRASHPAYRTYVASGWEILIGKSAASNDYITMKIAQPDDLWLHAESMPGSHVVVRNPEHRDIPREILAKAASLAAYYSKGRGSGKVAIAYTRARFVKKPKGAKPGTVTLAERKTVMAVPEE